MLPAPPVPLRRACAALMRVRGSARARTAATTRRTRRRPPCTRRQFYLRGYHTSLFTHLGGLFLDVPSGGEPSDVAALVNWVHGYHEQLARFGLDGASLLPSLADAAADL